MEYVYFFFFLSLMFICMPTCSLYIHWVIHSLSWLPTLDSCACVCWNCGLFFIFISPVFSLFEWERLMGQFKFAILIKILSFNLVHKHLCISGQLFTALLTCTLHVCMNSFIPSFICTYKIIIIHRYDANSIKLVNCTHSVHSVRLRSRVCCVCMFGMLSTTKSWVKSYMHVRDEMRATDWICKVVWLLSHTYSCHNDTLVSFERGEEGERKKLLRNMMLILSISHYHTHPCMHAYHLLPLWNAFTSIQKLFCIENRLHVFWNVANRM